MRYRTFLIISILLLVPLSMENSFAHHDLIEEDTELDSTEPIIYNMGIDLISVGAIDRSSGSSELIFWLTIVSDDIDFTKNPPPDDWYLANGYIIDLTGRAIEPHFHKVLMRGAFFAEVDFRNYPFDTIELHIHLEPYYPITADEMEFRINEEYSRVNRETVSVPGWTIGEPVFSAYTSVYPWADFPHLEAHFPIVTNPLDIFLKKLLPPILLGLFGFGTFFMSSHIIQNRIAIIATCLVGSLFFHAIFLLGELPSIGYLTLADKMMISIYTIFVGAGATILVHQHHLNRKEIEHDERDIQRQFGIDRKMAIITGIGMIVVFLALYPL